MIRIRRSKRRGYQLAPSLRHSDGSSTTKISQRFLLSYLLFRSENLKPRGINSGPVRLPEVLVMRSQIMPQAKIRSRLPRCSTPAVSHRAGLSGCVRPNAQIVPPSGLHDMRIAPRECLPQLEQMIVPPPPVTRWTSRRKAAVVAAVHSGEITLEAACGRYELSIEEFRAWESKVAPRSAFSVLAIDLLNSGRP
jgi:Protein of unknown function (DUF1153)